jgi:hypothetical protein
MTFKGIEERGVNEATKGTEEHVTFITCYEDGRKREHSEGRRAATVRAGELAQTSARVKRANKRKKSEVQKEPKKD